MRKFGAINIQLNIDSTSCIRSLLLDKAIAIIEFYIVEADTPFHLWFEDIDKLNVYFNKLKNILITFIKSVLVV